MLKFAVVAHENDNVATAVKDLQKGETVLLDIGGKAQSVTLQEKVAFGHKFAVAFIPKEGKVIKYGEIIGHAIEEIPIGHYAHVHNIVSDRGRGDLEVRGQ
ncbi:MAG: UxaA family hydrolase [Selenomonadales bacterium]|jgi:altronate dehydratase small subunit|nr:UxaA family hydrolase [Selenomonadales bacterium]